MSTVRVTLTGTVPLLLHNGRLANPLDPHTRALKALTSKRSKTDEDLAQIILVESRGAAYETPDNEIGLRDANAWRSMQEAARAFKRGADVERAVIYDPVRVAPILIDGGAVDVEEFLGDADHIDYRPVGLRGQTVMRARPIIREWSTSHDFDVLTDIVNIEDIGVFLTRAGRLHGVGDHRPQYGRFSATVEEI